eukprot:scaffold2306_cov282-Prasinococcus_capsulatus_cf.AAC.1
MRQLPGPRARNRDGLAFARGRRRRLQAGSEEALTEYRFGTHRARHLFCSTCGICSFYVPRCAPAPARLPRALPRAPDVVAGVAAGTNEPRGRSHPESYGVTVHCLRPGTVESVQVKTFDGEPARRRIVGGLTERALPARRG